MRRAELRQQYTGRTTSMKYRMLLALEAAEKHPYLWFRYLEQKGKPPYQSSRLQEPLDTHRC